MTRVALQIILVLACAIAALTLIECGARARLQSDLDRAEAQHQWAVREFEKSKRESE